MKHLKTKTHNDQSLRKLWIERKNRFQQLKIRNHGRVI